MLWLTAGRIGGGTARGKLTNSLGWFACIDRRGVVVVTMGIATAVHGWVVPRYRFEVGVDDPYVVAGVGSDRLVVVLDANIGKSLDPRTVIL